MWNFLRMNGKEGKRDRNQHVECVLCARSNVLLNLAENSEKKNVVSFSFSFFFFLDKKTSSEKCTQLLCIILIQSPGLFSYASGPLHV